MGLNKIKVRDSKGDYHVFKGDGIRFSRDGLSYDIYQFLDEDGETRRINLASFTSPISVKDEEAKASQNEQRQQTGFVAKAQPGPSFQTKTEDHLDPFTQAALDQRDPDDKPDYGSLAPKHRADQPDDTDNGIVKIEPQDGGHDFLSYDESAPIEKETFESLTAKYAVKKQDTLDLSPGTIHEDEMFEVKGGVFVESTVADILADAEKKHKAQAGKKKS